MTCGGPGTCGRREHCLDGHCPGHPEHPSNRWGAGRDVPDDAIPAFITVLSWALVVIGAFCLFMLFVGTHTK